MRVAGVSGAVAIAAGGGDSSMARAYSASNPVYERVLWTWGAGGEGQIGEGAALDWPVARRVWFFAVGLGTGCRDVREHRIGFDATTRDPLEAGLLGLQIGQIKVAIDTATPAAPGRGFFLFELASAALEGALVAYLDSTSLDLHHEKNCRLFSASARPPGCPTSSEFPQDHGYRRENNTNCDLRNDPDEHWQHNLQHGEWEAAWSRTRSTALTPALRTVKVAVLDTGFERTHRDFDLGAVDLAHSYDFVSGTPPGYPYGPEGVTDPDPSRHGTSVASFIAARTNDTGSTRGMAGTACVGQNACSRKVGSGKNATWIHPARLAVMRVLDASEVGTPFTVAAGISWAHDAGEFGAEVINLSLASLTDSPSVQAACDSARLGRAPTSTLFAAAGNFNSQGDADWVAFPAAYNTVLGVGSTQELAPFAASNWSNFGPGVDVWVPGELVLAATSPNTGSETAPSWYGYPTGTSMSAPVASGLVRAWPAPRRRPGAWKDWRSASRPRPLSGRSCGRRSRSCCAARRRRRREALS